MLRERRPGSFIYLDLVPLIPAVCVCVTAPGLGAPFSFNSIFDSFDFTLLYFTSFNLLYFIILNSMPRDCNYNQIGPHACHSYK